MRPLDRKLRMNGIHYNKRALPTGVEELRLEVLDAAEPFRGLEAHYKQMQYFAKSRNFIEPVDQQRDSATGIVYQVAVPDCYQRIPLQRFLHREGNALQDVFDGKFCKTHPLFLKEVSIPLLLYNGDCETVNPLGSKTVVHKLGFIYFILKSLPPDLLSSLRSHFLLTVYKSDDAKTHGLDAVLCSIVEEIRCLERDGITVDTPNFQGVVKFGHPGSAR
ncbi:hypothetical protein N1851_000033 [Merluccius polli]|uniref:Uncharacterized protein n=1 Tax=Merluccius polli TaxID=89951 RepID=A0AA47PA20_MERPO|nr:hypothetical protein N1851_000033 [Merluccius polli]